MASKADEVQMEYVTDAEEMTRLRDTEQNSWAKVAAALGLGSPGAARRLYTALVRPHTESVLEGRARSTASLEPIHIDEKANVDKVRKLIGERTIVVQRKDGTEDIYVAKVNSIKEGSVNFNDGDKSRSVKAAAIVGLR